ncbi:hypothetical protein AURDEDRAFT_77066 [Auricularia subglabra TFB-10046 SS5]|uniref:Uncharacterized protein n=1 Tax=Auricularia subglabra (strain TFB-10046 / SS5) TaxID=717982 RepID=J0WNA4_AURST|nr:hypothetical protein AURDEDRAFT_77066 [Auricularia subglabra TFB-10046 SS5]
MPAHRTTVEEIPDEEDGTFSEHFPGAGAVYEHNTPRIKSDFAHLPPGSWGPFPSEADWEFSKWAKTEAVSNGAVDRLLAIRHLHDQLRTKSMRDINKRVDSLPSPAHFSHFTTPSPLSDDVFDCYYRDALEVVADLLADPAFAGQLSFAPCKTFTDSTCTTRLYTELNTGDWAHETQLLLPDGATLLSIILSSDKTELTSFTGKRSCYPVYLTIGNISKHLRGQPSMRAHRLLAYLPTGHVDESSMSEANARRLRAALFHHCMRKICSSLFDPAARGVLLADSFGVVRDCYPVLAAYVADYPEQCLVTCVRYGEACPRCDILKAQFDKNIVGELRHQDDTLATISHANQHSGAAKAEILDDAGLNDVQRPFWSDWPHANIHAAITSDVLHQLVQGVGKHVVQWLLALAPKRELDARIRRLPPTHGLRHFSDGITHLSKIQGAEHKAIFAQILGCVHGIVPDDAVRAATALFDFIYIAQYLCHSDETLEQLQESIRLFGTTDNYNTEATERLHIDLAKHAFRATNKRNFVSQMCRWLERREAVFWFATHLAWSRGQTFDSRRRKLSTKQREPVVLAKRPDRPRVFLSELRTKYGVRDLRNCLTSFLAKWHNVRRYRGYEVQLPAPIARALAQVPSVRTWNRVKFCTPDTQTEAAHDVLNIALASPKHGRFDTVLVKTVGEDIAGQGGIRIGRLRAIFKVPKHYEAALFGCDPPGHLGYVEWFTKIPAMPNDVNGMFPVQQSYRSGGEREAEVIEIIDIRRACQLCPVFGRDPVDRRLKSHTILDGYRSFYLNNRSDKDAYRSIRWDESDDGE